MKLITVKGIDYVLSKNPVKGWDFRSGDTLIIGFSIPEIKERILSMHQ